MTWGRVSVDNYKLQMVLAILSTVGCLFIIFTFKAIKWNSKVHYRLVFWLACSLLLYTLEGLVASFWYYPNITVCFIAQCLSNLGEKASWMFASCISFNLLLMSKGYTNAYLQKKEKASILVCLVSSVLLTVGWMMYMVYGPYYNMQLENECDRYWAKKEELTMIAFPFFFLFNLGCIVVIFYRCIREWQEKNEVRTPLIISNRDSVQYFLLRLSFQPLMFFLGYIITFIDVVSNSVRGDHLADYDDTVFLQINYVSGFLCAIVYGFTPTLTNDYFNILTKQEQSKEMG